MSLGFEEIGEDEDEDSSKDIILKHGLHILYAKLLVQRHNFAVLSWEPVAKRGAVG